MPLEKNRSLMVLALGIFTLVAATVACTPAKALMGFKNEKVSYRVTVTVDTPEGVKTASAVREAGAYTEPSILPDQGGTIYNITRGEAVVIDMGARGVVFALLGDQGEAKVVSRAIRLDKKTHFEMKPLPRFVRFRDPADPKTVEAVKPDDFAAAFGEGVALKSVTIEMTRDDVTTGVVGKYMPSYKKDYEGFMRWFRSLPYEDPRQIGPDAFGSWGEL